MSIKCTVWNEDRLESIIRYIESLVMGDNIGFLKFETISTSDEIELRTNILSGESGFVKETRTTSKVENILKEKNIKYIRNFKDGEGSRMIFISRKSILEHKWENDNGFISFSKVNKYNL